MAGMGPERQRNHLDELPHTYTHTRSRLRSRARSGVVEASEKEKKRERRVSSENCGPSGSTIYDLENFVSVEARREGVPEGASRPRSARVIHM